MEPTPRQLEILALYAEGKRRPEIARRLVMTLGTVDSHMTQLRERTGAKSMAHAVAMGFREGWLR